MGAVALVAGIAVCGCGGSGSGGAGGGRGEKVSLVVWDGETNIPGGTAKDLAAEFHRLHPNITVTMTPGATGSSTILQKVTAALAGNTTPNISYLFGVDVAQIAQSPKVLDLTDVVKQPGWSWSDLFPASRDGMVLDGRVKAVPADMDDVAVFYNKKLFKQAGVPEPKPGWTWDDYRAAAKRVTAAVDGAYGTAFPGGGGNDTSWYVWPMIWQAGGDVLNTDGSEVAFGGAPGLRALQLLHDMAQVDKSVYVDTSPGYTKMLPLFNSGRVGLYLGDSWQIPGAQQSGVDYGVVPVPSWEPGGKPVTMASPDAWVMFDHGDAENAAAQEFLKWLTAPEQEARWDVAVASPALGPAAQSKPVYQRFLKRTPGMDVFNEQLAHNTKTPPVITSYSALMEPLGKAQATVLLEADADLPGLLDDAVQRANDILKTAGAP